jgi:transcriptional regulator with XRE-family HTH domain
MLEWVPNMPARLKELRQELGWTLGDVAERVGVTQRGVVSNWEATNQRHRIPDISNLLILQRWYGVSLDYLLGHPGAERESPVVKMGKMAVRVRLGSLPDLWLRSPTERARLASSIAIEEAPDAFFRDRLAVMLAVTEDDFAQLMTHDTWGDDQIERLADVLGLEKDSFYTPEPNTVLEISE